MANKNVPLYPVESSSYKGVNIEGGPNANPIEVHAYKNYSIKLWIPEFVKNWAKEQVLKIMEDLDNRLNSAQKKCINNQLGQESFPTHQGHGHQGHGDRSLVPAKH